MSDEFMDRNGQLKIEDIMKRGNDDHEPNDDKLLLQDCISNESHGQHNIISGVADITKGISRLPTENIQIGRGAAEYILSPIASN